MAPIANLLKDLVKRYWITLLVYAGMIGLYAYIANNKLVSAFLFPSTDAIIKSFIANKDVFLLNLGSSLALLIPAIVISLVIALTIGTIMGLSKKTRDALHPVLYTFSVVPSILLSPFALLLAPNFRAGSLFLIVYQTVWATVFGTITGIMTIDKRYLDKAETLEFHGLKRFFKVILPAASPSIISGFINSLSGTFVMLVYAEMYGTQYGMGYFVRKNAEFGLYDNVWSGFIFMVIVLVIVMQVFEFIRGRLLRWTIN